ncbi:uncharacterized protein LOC114182010 [Vigna unguiculata]|uniref:uncharacterized protein LOC114182010 n=1 Tax=Vigna unguiculata TaxID=3917 RepID=UPI00101715D9|nr:uncharacterized protein LOC114182010 [Vigna unguiculata]
MDHHVLSLLTISIFFFLAISPQSHCQEEGTDCSRPYTCGNVSNIYYPFWGQNRPSYCASSKQLKLNCEEDNQTKFQFESQNFTVLRIDTLHDTMRLVRTDIVYDDCGKNFTCKNDRTEFGFYAEMTEELSAKFPELERCERRIHVLIFREFWVESDGGIDSLQEAASHGFDVYYSGGGGLCRSMDTPENALHCVLPIPSITVANSNANANTNTNTIATFNANVNTITPTTFNGNANTNTIITSYSFSVKHPRQ